ncbi:MAG TPA: rhodanese-like domain-containing protein [Candidatus Binatia bacterium]|nr:rhodanese-like domain-containing protein [Candidatus Binatia bacterium]
MTRIEGIASFVVLCAVVWSAGCRHAATGGDPISPGDLSARIGSAGAPVVLDVRTPQEYASGHIPGAVNIPHGELATRLAEIPGGKSAEIVVHCQAGGRAATAEKVLAQQGYTNVRDLQGHFGGWVQQGFPVERTGQP